MWKKILIHLLAVINLSQFANGSKETIETEGIIIDEVCVPHQIAELERYLDEFDLPEAPISNTATYPYPGIDDGAVAESGKLPAEPLAVKEIESTPLGSHPADLKRLRILRDLLTLPEDRELRTKLLIFYEILIAANQRARKSARSIPPEETHTQKIQTAKNTPNYFGDGEVDPSETGKLEEGNFLTTSRQRPERSTYNQNYGHTDSANTKYEKEGRASPSLLGMGTTLNSHGFSETPETLNFDDKNSGRDAEVGGKSKPESNTVMPRIEEVGEKFKDRESGGGIIEPYEGAARAENHELETTDSGFKESSTDSNVKRINADSKFEGMITNSNFVESFTDSTVMEKNTDSIPKSSVTDSNFEVAVTDSNLKESDSKFEGNFAVSNLNEINTDSTPKSTITDSKFKVTVTDSNLEESDSKFEGRFTDPNLKEMNTDSTPRSTITDLDFRVAVTDSNLKKPDSKFEGSFTDLNLKEMNTDSTLRSTITDLDFRVAVTDSNLKNPDSKFEGSFTDLNLNEINTDSTPKSTITDSKFTVAVTDSNLEEPDSKFEGSFTDPNLKETNTDLTPRSIITDSKFGITVTDPNLIKMNTYSTPKSTFPDLDFIAAVTDSNSEETMIGSNFKESFGDPNSRGKTTRPNSVEIYTDSVSKSTVTGWKLGNTVADSDLGETVPDTNLKEAITASNLIKMVTEYRTSELDYIESSTVENLYSKSPGYELRKGEYHEEDTEEAKVTGFENRKSSEDVASETINEMRSPSPEGEVTTEEIKPDVRREDLATFSDPFISPSELLPIDQKRPGYIGYFTTPNYRGDKVSKIFLNYNKGPEGPAPDSDSASATTGKTFVLNIAESFSNIPRPVEVALFKKKDRKSENHISGMRNYEDEKNYPPPQAAGFRPKNRHRIGKESGGKLIANKPSSFRNFRGKNSGGRQARGGGHNTDVEKLFRWFYRGGDIPGKFPPGGVAVECNRKN